MSQSGNCNRRALLVVGLGSLVALLSVVLAVIVSNILLGEPTITPVIEGRAPLIRNDIHLLWYSTGRITSSKIPEKDRP
jgi:hypothetical protein